MGAVPGIKRPLIGAAVALCFAAPAAYANPTGATVVNGSASFATSGAKLTVTNTPGAIINWQQFSIQQNEVTRFIQQNAASSVLNRVIGGNPSAILGALTSNGRVFLINASGITIGRGAMIDVAGFAASTLNLANADFIAGRNFFQGTGGEGHLINSGTIRTAEGGHVYLIAPKVENQKDAVITSPKGEIVIAAGRTVELVNTRTPDVRVEFTAPGEAVNAGEIVAASGQIGIFGMLVKNSGFVSASRAVAGDGGTIVFKSAGDVLLEAGSRVEAVGDKGGSVQVLGERVGVLDGASIDVSGDAGGGTVLVGGDFQGRNAEVPNAWRTYFGADASIKADAIASGDGGKVIVWADDITRAYGEISARGGAAGGDGGFVEVSGKNLLDFAASVDASAPAGAAGTLLLDPTNITVAIGGGATTAQVDAFADAGGTLSISPATLNAAGTTVVLQATQDVTVNDPVNLTTLNAGFTAQAGRDVTINASVTTNAGKIILEADSPHQTGFAPDGDGLVRINAPVNSCGGLIPATCTGANITLIGGGNSSPTGGFVLNADVNAGDGGINVALSTNTLGLDFFIGAGGNTQLSSNDTGSLKTTGTLVLGRATSGGPSGLGAPVTGDPSTGAVVLTVDSLSQLNSTPMVLSADSGSIFQLVAGDGGITLDRDLTSFQTTLIETSGTFTLGAALDTSDSNLVITAANVDLSGGSVTTGTGIFGCVGSGCPAGTAPVNQWNVDASGDWLLGSNWTLGTPTSTHVVLIDRPSASPTIALGTAGAPADGFAGLLVNGETLNVTGNSIIKSTLSITADLTFGGTTASTNNGTLNLVDSVFSGAGALVNNGTLTLLDSSVNVALSNVGAGAQIAAAGANAITGSFTMLGGAFAVNSGTTTLSGNSSYAGSVAVAAGATLALDGGIQNVLAGGSLTGQAGSVVGVAGATVTVDAGASFDADTVNVASGSLSLHNAATVGTLALSGGTLDGTGDLSVTDEYTRTGGTLGTTFSDLLLTKSGAFTVDAGGITAVDSVKLISGGAVTLDGAVAASNGSGDAIVISGSSFTNNAGASALDPGAGRFLVWSGDPASDSRGGLTYAFKQYNASFGSTSVLGTGDGFLHTVAPTITAGLTGTVSKGYDANATATLAASNYTASGAIDGDTVTLNNPGSGSYDDKNAGTGKSVSVSGIAIASATDGLAVVYGYQLESDSASANIGEVTPASLTVSAMGQDKIYDGTVAATVTLGDNRIAGDVLSTSYTLAEFGDKNVGVAKAIDVSGIGLTGTDSSNYSFNISATASADVTHRTLTISAAGQDKVYDGTTVAAVTLTDNRIAGDVLTASHASADFNNRHVGTAKPVDVDGLGLSGTDAGNYTFNAATSTTASITPAPLTLAALADSRTYDGTTASAAAPTAGGLFGADSVTGLAQSFDSQNAGARTLSVNGGYVLDDGNGGGNYTVSLATAAGAINPALLTYLADAASRAADEPNPVFSGQVTGFVAGENLGNATTGPLLWASVAGATSVPGSYAIDGSGLTALNGNYTFQQAPGNAAALTIIAAALPGNLITPPAVQPVPEGSSGPQGGIDQTLLNLNTGETLFVPPNTIPDPGIYLSQDSSSVVVVGQSDLGSQLNVASTLLFPVVTPQSGTYVNSENGLLYAVEEGSLLDPGVYYNREEQTVLVVTTNEDGNVSVASADIKDAVQTVASGAGGRRVVSVACK